MSESETVSACSCIHCSCVQSLMPRYGECIALHFTSTRHHHQQQQQKQLNFLSLCHDRRTMMAFIGITTVGCYLTFRSTDECAVHCAASTLLFFTIVAANAYEYKWMALCLLALSLPCTSFSISISITTNRLFRKT